ncbi:MAG: PepSY domain-containing protein [Planctomycetaceae bacterium]|nr:PepSY domain-containing protein [Planctomycetaceae bacterium]
MKIFRWVAYELHLWLGIVSGLILFVVCLSGTLLTFKTEFIQYIEHERYYFDASNGSQLKSVEELVSLVEQSERGKVVRVTIPNATNQTWLFNVKKESVDVKKLPAGMPAVHAMLGTAYIVNPSTGESLGTQRSKIYMFFMMLTFLHRFLLLDIWLGQIIVGGATLIFLVLVITGLFLWLPAKITSIKGWSTGIKIRLGKSWSMFLYDVHNTLGFYILIPVVVMALTGPIISFSWYRSAFGWVLGARPFRIALEKPVQSKKSETIEHLKWDDFIRRGDEISKRKGITRLVLPQTPEGCVVFQRIGAGLCNIAATDKIQFDQYTGDVLKSDLFDDLSLNEKIASLIFPLHNGEIFGTVSKIIYFFACLIATSLPITGVILWFRKLRSYYKRRSKKTN